MSGINSGRWNRTILNLCGIVVAILKMATGRNLSMSGILKNFYRSPFSKWPPQYRTNSTLSNFNAISYVGRLWSPELIPDIDKFLPVAIFKMATTIPHKFKIVRFQRPELIPEAINSGHHYLPTYQILMISDNVEFLPPICYAMFWHPFWKWQTYICF
jgi:hypothetical protein